MGRVLQSAGAEVRLLAPQVEAADQLDVPCRGFGDRHELAQALADSDVVVAKPQGPTVMRELRRSGNRLIFDLLYPDVLEKLERVVEPDGFKRRLRIAITLDRFNEAMRIGHNFICGSERQFDLWVGGMMANGFIRPSVYDSDPSLRSVIDVVPFGLPEGRPEPDPDPWGSSFPEIAAGDEVILWNGGIWPWMDAQTAIRAVAELASRRPRARLIFMPGPGSGVGRDASTRARALASDLGVLNRHVFFNEEWVPYQARGSWLAAADCMVLCHGEGLEARFAFHSRVLDCFWAGLPPVSTDGDVFSDEIEREDLGAIAPSGDHAAVAGALERVLDRGRESYGAKLEAAADRYRWEKTVQPLIGFALSKGERQRLGRSAPRSAASALRTIALRLTEARFRAQG
ncbi:MAG: glycosyltransferase family 4 protein [Solirubrobacterales bacterium]|nr:glycosyltransferase family 4 protein [Solirubrobacterales bacterium]